MNNTITQFLSDCKGREWVIGAYGEYEMVDVVDYDAFAEMCSDEIDVITDQRNASNRKIEELTDELKELRDEYEHLLYSQYDKDPLKALYKVWDILPACPLLSVVGDAIQDLQYHKENIGG